MAYQSIDCILAKIFEYENEIPLEQRTGWHGVINDLFVRRYPLMHDELLPTIRSLCNSADFHQYVMDIRRHDLNKDREDALKALHTNRDDYIARGRLEHADKEIDISDFHMLLGKFESEFTIHGYELMYKNQYKSIHGSLAGFTEIAKNYGFYRVCSYLYDDYCHRLREREEIRSDNSFIQEYFARLGSDATGKPSFERYGLITLSDDFTIYNSKEIRCLRYKNDPEQHYLYLNISKPLMSEFLNLLKLSWIGSIAFKITCIQKFVPALEDLERGQCFALNLHSLPEISMLYDGANYDDRLYVKYSKSDLSLTFEELDDDFRIVDEYVRTQVIHMQFIKRDGKYYIYHFDHEYIYYTIDEYEKRKTDPDQKGKKIKTFKIDNANIPLTYKTNEIFFLYFILDNYLKHKRLLLEYFSSII